MNVCQLLLTRWNVAEVPLPDAWIEERFALFSHYCAPSIAVQRETDFQWLLYCDTRTPAAELERLRAFDPHICIVPVAPARHARADIAPHVPAEARIVLSTRLDSDDALHRDALFRVRQHVETFLALGHDRWLYNPATGYKLDTAQHRLFAVTMPNSPFLTLFERTDRVTPLGALSGNHSKMPDQYPTLHANGDPSWVQVVHGGNVNNRLRRRDPEVPLSVLGRDYGFRA